jgi:DMSO/TMAO reductase YedYZ molybdopterin-dependent catalytic subunit
MSYTDPLLNTQLGPKETTAEVSRSVALSATLINDPSNAVNLMYQAMSDEKHTWSSEGHYTRDEVNYAFHNHGSHHELLDMDITDIASHYVLLHFDAQNIPEDTYTLKIKGLINRPMSFTLDQIKKFPKHTVQIVMECAGSDRASSTPRFNHHSPWGLQPIAQAEWSGCLLTDVLNHCGGYTENAIDIIFTGADTGIESGDVINYQRSLNIEKDHILDDCLLIYEMNGQPLPKKHGFPLRLMVPGWYGMASVKYLKEIEVVPYRFRGRGMVTYSYSIHPEDPDLKQPVTIIRPRAIIKWPGIAEFFTRNRYLGAGLNVLQGRAWVGGSTVRRKEHIVDIAKVDLSFDNGDTWNETQIVDKRKSPWGWCKWIYNWNAIPGLYNIIVRATATDGVVQPVWPTHELWDYRSMGTIACQRVTVHVIPELYVGLKSVQSEEIVRDPKILDRKVY